MADLNTVIPWILGLLATAVAWLFKTVIQQGKDQVALQTAFKYYIEGVGKGSAMVLDKPNPTPPEISKLFRKYYDHGSDLTAAERERLKSYLRKIIDDPLAKPGDRQAAVHLYVGMDTLAKLTGNKTDC